MAFTEDELFQLFPSNTTAHVKSACIHQIKDGGFVDLHRNCFLEPKECKKNRLQNKACTFFRFTNSFRFQKGNFHAYIRVSAPRRFKKENSKINAIWPLYRGTTKRFYESFKEETTDSASSGISMLKKNPTEDEKAIKSETIPKRNNTIRRREVKGLRKKIIRKNFDTDKKSVSTKRFKRTSTSVRKPTSIPTTQNTPVQPMFTLQELLKMMVEGSNDTLTFKKSELYRRYCEILPTVDNEKGSILIELPETVKYKCKLDLSSLESLVGIMLEPELAKEHVKQPKSLTLNAMGAALEERLNQTSSILENNCNEKNSKVFLNPPNEALMPEIVVPENSCAINATLKYDKLAAPCILLPASMYPLNFDRSKNPNWTGYANGCVEPPVPVRVTSLNGMYDQTHFFNIPTIKNKKCKKLLTQNIQLSDNDDGRTSLTLSKTQARNHKPKSTIRKRGRKSTLAKTNEKSNEPNKTQKKLRRKPKPQTELLQKPTIIKCRIPKAIKTEIKNNSTLPTESIITNNASYLAALDMPLLNEDANRGPESNNSQQTQPSSGVFSAQSSNSNFTPSYHQDFKSFNCSFENLNLAAVNSSTQPLTGCDVGTAVSHDLLEQFHLGEVGVAQRDFNHDLSLDAEMRSTPLRGEGVQQSNCATLMDSAVVMSQFLDLSNFELSEINGGNQFQSLHDMATIKHSTLISNNTSPSEKIKSIQNSNMLAVSTPKMSNNENPHLNILQNTTNSVLCNEQRSEKRRLIIDNENKSPLAKKPRLSSLSTHNVLLNEAALTEQQLNVSNDFPSSTDSTIFNKHVHLQQQRNNPENQPHVLFNTGTPSLSRVRNNVTKRDDVKVISNQIIKLPVHADKNSYQVKFNKPQKKQIPTSKQLFRDEIKPLKNISTTPSWVRSERIQNATALRERDIANKAVAHNHSFFFINHGDDSKGNIESLRINQCRTSPTITSPRQVLRLTSGSLSSSSSQNKLFGKNEEIHRIRNDFSDENTKSKIFTSDLNSSFKNSLGLFMPPLEFKSKKDDCLDFEDDSVVPPLTENGYLSSHSNVKNEFITESSKNSSQREIESIGASSITTQKATMGQEQIDLKKKSAAAATESMPPKIVARRKSDGNILMKRNRASRFSVDQMSKEIASSERISVYKYLNGENTQNDVAKTQFSLKDSDPRRPQDLNRLQKNSPTHRNLTVTSTTEPNQGWHLNIVSANNKPIFIEVPADPPMSDRNDINEFYKTAEELLSSTGIASTGNEKNTSTEVHQILSHNHQNAIDIVSGVEIMPSAETKINNSNDNCNYVDYLKFFNIQCVASLTNVTDCCSSKPHAPFRDKKSVQTSLLCMTPEQVHDLYVFVRRKKKLFSIYYEAFWFYFSERSSIKGLCCLLHDGEYYECFSSNTLQFLHLSFQKCGLSTQDACELLLRESKQRTTATINSLIEIIIESDWTLFGDSMKTLAMHPAAVFTSSILERLAGRLVFCYNTQLASIFFSCLLQFDATQVGDLFNNEAVRLVFNLMYANLHN